LIGVRPLRHLCALAALLVVAGGTHAAEIEAPQIQDTIEYRDITGTTEDALAAALKQVAANDASGDRFAASTRWQLRWNFRVEAAPGAACHLASAKTELDIHMTLPRWMPPPNAAPALVKHWNLFATALRKHEDGHRDIAIEAARVIADRAAHVPPGNDCATLKKDLGRVADDTLREYKDKESSYDVTTIHGQTQGATFP
jgi:predicted secreted Zn-dependent protease